MSATLIMPIHATTTLILPFPPGVNHYWRHAVVKGRAIVYISAAGKKYRNEVIGIVANQRIEKYTGRLMVTIVINAPCNRRRDVDNYAKSLLDSLTHAGVWLDDEQIDRLLIMRGSVKKPGGVTVEITETQPRATT